MNSMGQDIGVFLVGTLFSIYITIVMLRMLLAWARADFYNPLSQAIVKLTNPLVVPLRRIIPSIGKIDTAALLLLLALKVVQLSLLALIGGGGVPLLLILYVAVVQLVELCIYIFIFALIIQAILSWVSPGYGNPLASVLYSLTEPLLRPIRRIVPPAGMIDFSSMVAIILLYVLLIALQHLL